MADESATPSALSRLSELNRRVDAGELTEEAFELELEALKESRKPAKRREMPKPREYSRSGTPLPTQTSVLGEVQLKRNRVSRLRFRAISRETVLELGKSIQDEETRALFFTLYLTGGRISEVLNLKASDVESKPATSERPASIVFYLKTLKRRNSVPQRAAAALEQGIYADMIAPVKAWRDKQKNGEDVLFALHRQLVHYRLTRLTAMVSPENNPRETLTKKINPHYLRRCRLSHLVKHHQFTDSMLREFVQWRNSVPAAEYVSLDEETLAKAQKEGN